MFNNEGYPFYEINHQVWIRLQTPSNACSAGHARDVRSLPQLKVQVRVRNSKKWIECQTFFSLLHLIIFCFGGKK